MRILLVEDDPTVGKALAQALRDEGMAVDRVRDGDKAEAALFNPGHALGCSTLVEDCVREIAPLASGLGVII